MTNLANLPAIDAIADNDLIYVRDTSAPGAPDKSATGAQLRPPGARITNFLRYVGNIAVPAMAASAEGTATIAVSGAQAGDHVVFNMQDSLAADLIIGSVRVSADDTVSVRFRNMSSSTYAGGSLACTALVIRSAA
jgi:hypothetical protein